MRPTWRVLLWEYGLGVGTVTTIPILALYVHAMLTGVRWPVLTLCLVTVAIHLAALAVNSRYPKRSDLPEWKEYERRVDAAIAERWLGKDGTPRDDRTWGG